MRSFTCSIPAFFLFFLLLSGHIAAQQLPLSCASGQILEYYSSVDPAYYERLAAAGRPAEHTTARTGGLIYRIPVVFHVVHNIPEENLPDSVLLNQLEVLNDAFRKRHAGVDNVREVFRPLSADTRIEFYLAEKDPTGRPATGITRTYTDTKAWGDENLYVQRGFLAMDRLKHDDSGGKSPWDVARYLNIWVADIGDPVKGPGTSGYAKPPVNPLPPNWYPEQVPDVVDGVVVQYQLVGSNNPFAISVGGKTYQDRGMTAVHEVGHYLGLRHIWGDGPPGEASCIPFYDDGIDDTPYQSRPSTGIVCPPDTKNTCRLGGGDDLPDMWENYMDYTHDPCMSMFTEGQSVHMRTILEAYRTELAQRDMYAGSLEEPAGHGWEVYPQPASGRIYVRTAAAPQFIRLYDVQGRLLRTWDGTASGDVGLDIEGLCEGMYIMMLRFADRTSSGKVVIR